MARRHAHARSLQALFRVVLATVTSATAYGAIVSGCGGDTVQDQPGVCAVASDAGVAACNTSFRLQMRPGSTPEACGFSDSRVLFGTDCERFCGRIYFGTYRRCEYDNLRGEIFCDHSCPVDGRRPEGLVANHEETGTLGGWFARMAHNEAAAIEAFAIVETELSKHHAPRSLRASVARARRDEVRHARAAAALARRHGGAPRRPTVHAEPRTLLAMAIENAREGCARETIGAMVGHHQAEHASTPELRRFYAKIARDETRHAALSWRMHAWFLAQLTREDRRLVEEVLDGSLTSLTIGAPESLRVTLGLPSDDRLRAMIAAFAAG
ncbi:MAG: hypothetical protein K1X94_22475 [Sandaracinaceae bacterium]|nr:hypothetical protein [Sandaracinaceae bacterium]